MLTPEFIAMIDRGVSAIVASRSRDHRPSAMRAVGSCIAPDGQFVTVYLTRPHARQLLQDLGDTGMIAVVFSDPASHRTVQLKASNVAIRPAETGDEAVLERYLRSMEKNLAQVGFAGPYARVMLQHKLEETVAVSFKPEQAFDQTPGPQAGRALGASAEAGGSPGAPA